MNSSRKSRNHDIMNSKFLVEDHRYKFLILHYLVHTAIDCRILGNSRCE
jgi:hypothetical protein